MQGVVGWALSKYNCSCVEFLINRLSQELLINRLSQYFVTWNGMNRSNTEAFSMSIVWKPKIQSSNKDMLHKKKKYHWNRKKKKKRYRPCKHFRVLFSSKKKKKKRKKKHSTYGQTRSSNHGWMKEIGVLLWLLVFYKYKAKKYKIRQKEAPVWSQIWKDLFSSIFFSDIEDLILVWNVLVNGNLTFHRAVDEFEVHTAVNKHVHH